MDSAAPETPAGYLGNPMMRRLYEYWRGKCQAGRLPSRSDIDPLDIPSLLSHLSLIDVVRADGRLRFRLRLIGGSNIQLMGGDCTGKFMDEILGPDDAERVCASYREVVERREPHFWHASLHLEGREHIRYTRLMLPLASDGVTVDVLIALYVPAELGAS